MLLWEGHSLIQLVELSEKLRVKSLRPGVGFYDPPLAEEKPSASRTKSLPDFVQEEGWDFEDIKTYQKILSGLETPWLGEKESFSGSAPAIRPKTPHALEKPLPVPTFSENKKALKNISLKIQLATSPPVKNILTDTLIAGMLFFFPLFLFLFLNEIPFAALGAIGWKIIFAFLLFSEVYRLLCRVFCGQTYGEMLAGRRLCKSFPSEQEAAMQMQQNLHPMLLFWRFALSCATGVVVLPLLSYIFGRDFLSYLTRLWFFKTCKKST